MADNSNENKTESNTIHLSEQSQIDYWTEFLGCTEAQLRSAIKLVGNSLTDVRKYFTKY
ncbi:MAG: DUF3606 domain-containing protein [Bacteroidetes bacterium]|nr:DUF3606 domain-containing protein [Bacteroidota bacterium]